VVPSEEALLCELSKLYRPTVAINEDEDQGGRTVVLPLSGCRHGERGAESLGVELTPTRDGHGAGRFIRRVLKMCQNEYPAMLEDGGSWYPKALRSMSVPWKRVTFGKRNKVE